MTLAHQFGDLALSTAPLWNADRDRRLLELRKSNMGWRPIGRAMGIPAKDCEGHWKALQRANGLPTTSTVTAVINTDDAEGPGDTVKLRQRAGQEFEEVKVGPSKDARQFRRKPGLTWLYDKGRLAGSGPNDAKDHLLAGERFGASFRAVTPDVSLKSCLNDGASPAGTGDDSKAEETTAEWRMNHRVRLTNMRAFLHFDADMIFALEQVCGWEKTPREVFPDRAKAEKLEADLIVALRLLVIFFSEPYGGGWTPKYGAPKKHGVGE